MSTRIRVNFNCTLKTRELAEDGVQHPSSIYYYTGFRVNGDMNWIESVHITGN
jgi:hypothetical protein